MPTSIYSVIFIAKLKDGASRPDALKALHSLFKLQKPQIQTLLQRAPTPLKQKLDKPQADKITKALWKAGWHSEIHCNSKRVFTTQKQASSKNTSGNMPPAADTKPISTSAKPVATKLQAHKRLKAKTAAPTSKTPPPVEPGVKIKRLNSASTTCSICVPDSWDTMATLNPNACLQAGSAVSESYLIIIEQKKDVLGGTMPVMQYATAVTDTAAKGVQNGQVVIAPNQKENKKTQQTYVVSEMRGMVAATPVHYLIAVYESNSSFFTAYFWCSEATFPKRQKLFGFLVRSFRL